MATARLFVAVVPPATVRAELAALAIPLGGMRWTPEENLHLTLRFIGDTEPEKQTRIEAALTRVRVEPFILPVAGLGVFPSRGPAKVLWAGTGGGHPRLHQLRKQVDEALLAVDAALDVHSFHPHFTLGRLGHDGDAQPLAKFLERQVTFEAPPFRVTGIHLLASVLAAGRPPDYEMLRSFPLET